MRKGRIIGALILVLSMIIGIPVYAEGNNSGLKLDVTGPTGMSGTSAKVGDKLTFNIELSGMKGNDALGGSYLSFSVAETPDVLDSKGRIGAPEMTTTCNYIGGDNNSTGYVNKRLDANIKNMDGAAEVVVTLPITDNMKGKTLYYKVDLRPDFADDPPFAEKEGTINVEDDKNPVPIEPQITITADIKADISKLEKGKAFPIELTVTNPNQSDLANVFADAEYSETGIYDENGNDTEVTPVPLGTFTELPQEVIQPEAGMAYIPRLASGASVTLKLNALIPETYGKENIVLSFTAMSFENEQQEMPTTLDFVEIKGTIAKAVPEVPEKPEPPAIDTPKSDGNVPEAATPVQPKPVVKKTAPKTGDTESAAGMAAALIGAMAVMGVVLKKRVVK